MVQIDVELVVGLINKNRTKIKKQFSLSPETIRQLDYIFADMKKSHNQNSYSAIIEQALNAYYTLYTLVEKLEEK